MHGPYALVRNRPLRKCASDSTVNPSFNVARGKTGGLFPVLRTSAAGDMDKE